MEEMSAAYGLRGHIIGQILPILLLERQRYLAEVRVQEETEDGHDEEISEAIRMADKIIDEMGKQH